LRLQLDAIRQAYRHACGCGLRFLIESIYPYQPIIIGLDPYRGIQDAIEESSL